MKKAGHQVFRYPSSRIGTIDLGQVALRKHHIAALLEVDVTTALARLGHPQGDAQSVFCPRLDREKALGSRK